MTQSLNYYRVSTTHIVVCGEENRPVSAQPQRRPSRWADRTPPAPSLPPFVPTLLVLQRSRTGCESLNARGYQLCANGCRGGQMGYA